MWYGIFSLGKIELGSRLRYFIYDQTQVDVYSQCWVYNFYTSSFQPDYVLFQKRMREMKETVICKN